MSMRYAHMVIAICKAKYMSHFKVATIIFLQIICNPREITYVCRKLSHELNLKISVCCKVHYAKSGQL